MRHILFPIDFSERCRAVRPFVATMARKLDAKVTLLHVVDARGGQGFPYPNDYGMDLAPRPDGAWALLKFFESTEYERPVDVAAEIVSGEPAARIACYAEDNKIDLIMMPTQGFGAFRQLLVGSVTAKVLYDALCPVWTAAHTEAGTLNGHAKLRQVLCAVNLTPEDVVTIRRAADLAEALGAQIRLVHVVPDPEPHPMGFDTGFRRSYTLWSIEELAKMQKEAGTNLETCVESGSVGSVVRHEALHHGADLVVTGRNGLHRTLVRLRNPAHGIISEAPCPVLSL